jgi:hypothetical protein
VRKTLILRVLAAKPLADRSRGVFDRDGHALPERGERLFDLIEQCGSIDGPRL